MAPESPSPLAHTCSRFEFAVAAPYAIVAPLFGAEAERKWGGSEWDPRFLHPETPQDTQGMIFTLDRHAHRSVWVNTIFDLEAGRAQYVYFIHETLVTMVDIRIHEAAPDRTAVEVVYERTALHPGANDHVRALGERDLTFGEEWRLAIEGYIAASARSARQNVPRSVRPEGKE